jgi:hypothetical protein
MAYAGRDEDGMGDPFDAMCPGPAGMHCDGIGEEAGTIKGVVGDKRSEIAGC